MVKPRRGLLENIQQIKKKKKPDFNAKPIPASAKGAFYHDGAVGSRSRAEAGRINSADCISAASPAVEGKSKVNAIQVKVLKKVKKPFN